MVAHQAIPVEVIARAQITSAAWLAEVLPIEDRDHASPGEGSPRSISESFRNRVALRFVAVAVLDLIHGDCYRDHDSLKLWPIEDLDRSCTMLNCDDFHFKLRVTIDSL